MHEPKEFVGRMKATDIAGKTLTPHKYSTETHFERFPLWQLYLWMNTTFSVILVS